MADKRTKQQQEAFDKAEAKARKSLVEQPKPEQSKATKRTPAQQAQFDAAEALNRERGDALPYEGETQLEVQSTKLNAKAKEIK